MAKDTFILSTDLSVAPEVKILKAKDYCRFTEASDVLAAARQRAGEIIAAAEGAYKKEQERGYNDGLAEGRMEMSGQMLDNVANTISYYESVEEKVTGLVMDALKKILGSIDDRTLITRTVHSTLSVVRSQKEITVKVAPEQVEAIQEQMTEILSGYPGISFLDVVADKRLGPTDCVLESGIGTVDGSISQQLDVIRTSLEKCFKR